MIHGISLLFAGVGTTALYMEIYHII